ncbi:hypothetical protein [Alcanivorax sp.]|uniref:hypothetical protein n=1 Tax=Alcanivorax sp. TaxID=1872427 RepID=UPI0025BA7DD1|nr:hypothetical protein [Alcanivorax sp.]
MKTLEQFFLFFFAVSLLFTGIWGAWNGELNLGAKGYFEGKQAYLISAAFVVSGLGALVSGIYWKKSERFQAVGGVIIGLGFFALWFAF